MKKTSTYARKRRHSGGLFNGAEWLNTVSRCRPYTDEPLPGAVVEGTTQEAATKSMLRVRSALDQLRSGQTPAVNESDFDGLAHALGVACIRAGQIAGEDPADNALLPPLIAGNVSLKRVLTRRQRFRKWQLLPDDAATLNEAVEVYETILQASSPAQMVKAADMHAAWLKGKVLETLD